MAKGDVNAKVAVHYDADAETLVWELLVGTHEEFTKPQLRSLVTEANTSFAAFQTELATIKPNWDLTTAQEDGLWEAVKELDTL